MSAPQGAGALAVFGYLAALAVATPEVATDALIIGGLLAVCVALTLAFGERVAE